MCSATRQELDIGIRTMQNDDGSIDIDMNGYKNDLIKRHGFLGSHRASAPGKPGVALSELDLATPETTNPPNVTKFRSRIGGTLWLSRGGLPVVGYQVAALARFNHAPRKKHWDASSNMMRFIATSVAPHVVFQFQLRNYSRSRKLTYAPAFFLLCVVLVMEVEGAGARSPKFSRLTDIQHSNALANRCTTTWIAIFCPAMALLSTTDDRRLAIARTWLVLAYLTAVVAKLRLLRVPRNGI
jgi:hypothetical protein